MANNLFFADLDGHTYYELFKQAVSLDRSITSNEERQKQVDKIINDNPYLVKYFSDYYDCHLLMEDHLSSDNNICNIVEMLTNYLLMSEDGRELEKREKTYYVDSRHIDRKQDKPMMINDDTNTMVVEFNKENYKLDKKQKIYSEDLSEDSYCGSVLRDYQSLVDTIDRKLKAGSGNQIKLSKMKHEVIQDMLLAKNQIKGVYGENIISPESHDDDYYASLSDPDTIRKLLTLNLDKRDAQKSSTWLLSLDFENLLKKVDFSDQEKEILDLYRKEYTLDEISLSLNIPRSTCGFWIKKIVNKIATTNENYTKQFLTNKMEAYKNGLSTTRKQDDNDWVVEE